MEINRTASGFRDERVREDGPIGDAEEVVWADVVQRLDERVARWDDADRDRKSVV